MTAVLLVGTSLARTSGGGVTFLEGLLETLSYCDVELHVVGPGDAANLIDRSFPGAHRIEVSSLVGVRRVLRDLGMTRRWATMAKADIVIHPNDLMPGVDVPLVTVVQNIGPFHPESRGEFGFRGTLYRRGISRGHASVVVSVSEIARRHLGPRLNAPISRVIREAVPLPPPDIGHGGSRVAVVSGTARYKNPALAERAAAACRAAGLQVTSVGGTHGQLPRPALLRLFASSTALIFPSRVESFGLPAIEAAGMGARPVVLAGTAMAEMLDGIAYVADSDATLVAAAELIADGRIVRLDEQERIGVRAHFSPTRVAGAWSDLFREVLRG